MKLVTALLKEPLTVFLVGMQCRSWTSMWKVPIVAARMTRMQRELREDPDSGLLWGENFLCFSPFTTLFLSYWRSSAHVERFASGARFSHRSSATEYWKRFRDDPHLGVWHETYEVTPEGAETLYGGMAPFGVSAFNPTVPVSEMAGQYLRRLRAKP